MTDLKFLESVFSHDSIKNKLGDRDDKKDSE